MRRYYLPKNDESKVSHLLFQLYKHHFYIYNQKNNWQTTENKGPRKPPYIRYNHSIPPILHSFYSLLFLLNFPLSYLKLFFLFTVLSMHGSPQLQALDKVGTCLHHEPIRLHILNMYTYVRICNKEQNSKRKKTRSWTQEERHVYHAKHIINVTLIIRYT